MNNERLDPTVMEFKQFINNHPKLLGNIRRSGRSWQEYYEQWALLGEEDPLWDQYKTADKTSEKKTESAKENNFELLSQLMKLTENMDINKVQKQVHQLSNTITTVQEVLGQYQESKKPKDNAGDPFNWFRD
nr:YlbD family protein [Virgibacillus profundi]